MSGAGEAKAAGTAAAERSDDAVARVEGERSIAAVHRTRSLESRLSNLLALGVMCTLGVGMLAWYYRNASQRPQRAAQSAREFALSRAQGEMVLPALGPVVQPETRTGAGEPHTGISDPPAAAADPVALSALPLEAANPSAGSAVPPAIPGASAIGLAPTPFERRLSGPAFARQSDLSAGSEGTPPARADAAFAPTGAEEAARPPAPGADRAPERGSSLGALLRPTLTPAADARVLPTERFLLAKGAFIDCTLETAIDSTLAGMTTCITATDTFSADGKIVLLERGSKLIGETHGDASQGSSRVFVLWTQARTASGVVVPLDSPGTDELGRAGVAGSVNRHFWQRFGAALLISIVDGGVQAGVQALGHGTVIYTPTTSADVTTEVLKGTINIPPTIVKPQGDRIQVLVARDIDFRSVYELRTRSR